MTAGDIMAIDAMLRDMNGSDFRVDLHRKAERDLIDRMERNRRDSRQAKGDDKRYK
jgi:hypothetical protein